MPFTINNTVAWHCSKCGRVEAGIKEKYCPNCGTKMQRCSRYEWFLSDEIRKLLKESKRKYKIIEQYPINDHRGFNFYWDLYIWVDGKSHYGGYGEVIDINGKDHDKQKNYSGPFGGYTRDDDKYWETFNNQMLHKFGIDVRYIPNEDCMRKTGTVYTTAKKVVSDLIKRSDNWC